MLSKLKKLNNKIVRKLLGGDDSHEFKPILSEIEDAPVNPIGFFTFWTVVILIVITIGWLFIGQVDIVVTARGIVIPDGEAKIIQPLDSGVISGILVKEGDFVKKGQILMEIDPSTTAPELKSAQTNLKGLNIEMERLKASSNDLSFVPPVGNFADLPVLEVQQNLYNTSNDALRKQLTIKETELLKVEDQINSAKKEQQTYVELLKSFEDKERRLKNVLDVIAYSDYEDVINQIKNYRSNVEKLDYKLSELASQKNQIKDEIKYTKADFKSQNLEQLAQKQQQAIQLKANVDTIKFRNTKQKIIAPCDGYVDKLFIYTVGGVVTPAQKLIALTPSNTPLLIKATVQNQDIGFVSTKLPVAVKVDTFSFQKYGMLKGEVKSISKNSIMDEKLGPVYEVYVTPITKTLMVEGKEQSIQTGMTLSSEIKVGKRRIIEFFVYPLIKYLNEGISVR